MFLIPADEKIKKLLEKKLQAFDEVLENIAEASYILGVFHTDGKDNTLVKDFIQQLQKIGFEPKKIDFLLNNPSVLIGLLKMEFVAKLIEFTAFYHKNQDRISITDLENYNEDEEVGREEKNNKILA